MELERLLKQNVELVKEIQFLKKSGSILCQGNRLAQYQFIQKYHEKFGVRWLFRKFSMIPNVYYNYLKDRKKEYRERMCQIQKRMVIIYHREDGVSRYRQMQSYLAQEGYQISPMTCHHYMSGMGMKSIVRRRKPNCVKGYAHKVFTNILNREFTVSKPNLIWAADFTYLSLADGTVHR